MSHKRSYVALRGRSREFPQVWPYFPGRADGEPIFYGLKNQHGDLAAIACYNNDLENFWDYIDEGIYPLKPSVEAFRLGINFLIYSMSH